MDKNELLKEMLNDILTEEQMEDFDNIKQLSKSQKSAFEKANGIVTEKSIRHKIVHDLQAPHWHPEILAAITDVVQELTILLNTGWDKNKMLVIWKKRPYLYNFFKPFLLNGRLETGR